MKKSYIFLAPGFEEVEALATADVMRRAGMEVSVVAVADGTAVTGSHNLTVVTDMMLADADLSDADWLIFPGGMPGAQNLHDDATLMDALRAHAARGGRYAAICAAPAVVLAQAGLLEGKQATCYPGFEELLQRGGASYVSDRRAVTDGNAVTANGPSSAIDFGLAIVQATLGDGAAQSVADGMLC